MAAQLASESGQSAAWADRKQAVALRALGNEQLYGERFKESKKGKTGKVWPSAMRSQVAQVQLS